MELHIEKQGKMSISLSQVTLDRKPEKYSYRAGTPWSHLALCYLR